MFVTPDNCLPEIRRSLMSRWSSPSSDHRGGHGLPFRRAGSVPAPEAGVAATLDGAPNARQTGDLDFVRELGRLDLVVTGACAVDPHTGVGFGKGHGYFDIEWAISLNSESVDSDTPVVICVHDCQVVDTGLTPSAHDTAGNWIPHSD